MVFINRRTNPEKTEHEKRMRTPGKALSDFKEQFKIVKSLMTRIEEDCTQIKVTVNFLEDNVLKKKGVVRKGFSSRPYSSV